jgi:hypothetical protein
MKKIIVVLILLAAGFYWYSGRGKAQPISEADVREFYRVQYEPANLFDAEMACASMVEEYRSKETVHSPGAGPNLVAFDKQQACDGARTSAQMLRKLVDTAGTQPQASYELRSIQISVDGATATVVAASTFRIPGKMKVQSTGTSALIKRDGKVLSLGGDSTTYMARD